MTSSIRPLKGNGNRLHRISRILQNMMAPRKDRTGQGAFIVQPAAQIRIVIREILQILQLVLSKKSGLGEMTTKVGTLD